MNPELNKLVEYVHNIYQTQDFISLHEPRFVGREKELILDCINSTFVSSVGKYVDSFEQMLVEYTGAKYAIATVNGTSALHISLLLVGVEKNTEVITQPLSFIATCNAISYCGADPVFVDVDTKTLGLSSESLASFLSKNAFIKNNKCFNKKTKRHLSACVPMHTFGHPCEIDKIRYICDKWKIPLVEDAAESLGSFYKGKHTGTFGSIGVFSFNGNKIVTAGGGGAIITNDETLALKAKHLTTTARVPHKWDFYHDMVGYNYRMPNLNAALLCAQIEQLDSFLQKKRALAGLYQNFCSDHHLEFIVEPKNAKSNYWLNTILLKDKRELTAFLEFSSINNVMTRPVWILLNKLPMFKKCLSGPLENSLLLADRLVNIPSSVI